MATYFPRNDDVTAREQSRISEPQTGNGEMAEPIVGGK